MRVFYIPVLPEPHIEKIAFPLNRYDGKPPWQADFRRPILFLIRDAEGVKDAVGKVAGVFVRRVGPLSKPPLKIFPHDIFNRFPSGFHNSSLQDSGLNCNFSGSVLGTFKFGLRLCLDLFEVHFRLLAGEFEILPKPAIARPAVA